MEPIATVVTLCQDREIRAVPRPVGQEGYERLEPVPDSLRSFLEVELPNKARLLISISNEDYEKFSRALEGETKEVTPCPPGCLHCAGYVDGRPPSDGTSE